MKTKSLARKIQIRFVAVSFTPAVRRVPGDRDFTRPTPHHPSSALSYLSLLPEEQRAARARRWQAVVVVTES